MLQNVKVRFDYVYVKKMMKRYGIIQADLADAFGVSRATIANLMRGVKPMTLEYAYKIYSVLSYRMSHMIFEDVLIIEEEKK